MKPELIALQMIMEALKEDPKNEDQLVKLTQKYSKHYKIEIELIKKVLNSKIIELVDFETTDFHHLITVTEGFLKKKNTIGELRQALKKAKGE